MSQRDPLDDLARDLFRAARIEGPSDSARRRTLDAMGVSRVGHESAGSNTQQPTSGRRAAIVVLGFSAAAAAAVALALQHAPSTAPELTAEPPSRHPATAKPAASPELDSPAPKLEQKQPATPSSPTRQATPLPTPSSSSLADEVAALDRARAALGAGDPLRALAVLDEYRARRGTRLEAEAALLRIEALAQSGRSAEAAALTERFIAAHPNSPLVDRARALGSNLTQGGKP